jgi:hypothetical protein
MRVIVAIIGSLILLPIAAFCVFGFMATFEPDETFEFMAFRIGYTVIGAGCLAGVMALTVRCFRKQ